MIGEHFISANSPYIPTGFEEVEIYVKHKKEHYFDALDFKDPVLQGSGLFNGQSSKLCTYSASPPTAVR